MSLLLEALKKAEKAKEEAQRRAKGEAPPASGLDLVAEEGAAESKPVLTRPELPDIRQPLEILSEEIAPRQATTEPQSETRAEARATARKVFEAKFKEPNPRLPFYIMLGLLGTMGLGVSGYFWYQLRPPPSLVNANPARTAQELAIAPGEARPAPAGAPLAAAGSVEIPGLPASAPRVGSPSTSTQ